jgi:hypothetical protein
MRNVLDNLRNEYLSIRCIRAMPPDSSHLRSCLWEYVNHEFMSDQTLCPSGVLCILHSL